MYQEYYELLDVKYCAQTILCTSVLSYAYSSFIRVSPGTQVKVYFVESAQYRSCTDSGYSLHRVGFMKKHMFSKSAACRILAADPSHRDFGKHSCEGNEGTPPQGMYARRNTSVDKMVVGTARNR